MEKRHLTLDWKDKSIHKELGGEHPKMKNSTSKPVGPESAEYIKGML